MYLYICINTYICTCIYVHLYAFTNEWMHICMYIYICKYNIYIHAYICICIYVHLYTFTHVWVHLCIYVYISKYIPTYLYMHGNELLKYIFIYINNHMHTHTYIYIYLHIYIYMYIARTRIYIYMHGYVEITHLLGQNILIHYIMDQASSRWFACAAPATNCMFALRKTPTLCYNWDLAVRSLQPSHIIIDTLWNLIFNNPTRSCHNVRWCLVASPNPYKAANAHDAVHRTVQHISEHG